MAARPLWLVLATALLLPRPGFSQEIYKWVDEQGQIHFSNLPRSGNVKASEEGKATEETPKDPEAAAVASDDPMRGFATRTQAAVNSVEFQLSRKNRDLRRSRFEREKVRDEVADAEIDVTKSAKLPELRLRERRLGDEVERLEREVSEMEIQIAKLRALQALGEAEAQ